MLNYERYNREEVSEILVFSERLIDQLFVNTKRELPNVKINKEDLVKEIAFFELTMKQVVNHPWLDENKKTAKRDTSSELYKRIQEKFVGPDPEEDYRSVIVWEIADLLYVTAAVDHNPSIEVKWDVVVFDANKQLN